MQGPNQTPATISPCYKPELLIQTLLFVLRCPRFRMTSSITTCANLEPVKLLEPFNDESLQCSVMTRDSIQHMLSLMITNVVILTQTKSNNPPRDRLFA